VPSAIVRGESALGITYIQYTVQTKGPINFAPIDKVFADPSDAALGAKAINPNAAKVFIDYLCSADGQKKIAETGEFVLASGIFPAIKGADKVVSSMIAMNDVSAEQLAKLQSDFRPLFLSK
jgi:ABC-type Fe3+ transport system substrate-binding protein